MIHLRQHAIVSSPILFRPAASSLYLVPPAFQPPLPPSRPPSRHASSSSSSPTSPAKAFVDKSLGYMKKFGGGMKNLFGDGKQAFYAYRSLKATPSFLPSPSSSSSFPSSLPPSLLPLRNEYRLLRETLSSFLKLFPLILIWIPPGLGFIPVALYVYFPREIYTKHFWTDEEKTIFLEEQYRLRKTNFSALRKELKKALAKAAAAAEKKEEEEGKRKAPEQSLWSHRALFLEGGKEEGQGGLLSLSCLPPSHLRLLAKANQLMKVEWMMEAVPLPYLRWLLQRRANEIYIDDLFLRAASASPSLPSSLSLGASQEACDARGLPFVPVSSSSSSRPSSLPPASLLLSRWLSIYSSFTPPSLMSSLPSSSYSLWWPGASASAAEALLNQLTSEAGREGGKEGGRTVVPPPASLLLHMPAMLQKELEALVLIEGGKRGGKMKEA